ncbi:serine O-acetyltransferase [Piscinibacter sp.]|uniref:serine O-acetyltransferase n=1 Tax=Piscinibacter sp. TaxID=1903157 RepID=UPI0039E64CAF
MLIADLAAKRELYAQYGTPCSALKALMADGTTAVLLYRLQQALARIGLAPLALIPHQLNKILNGCVIGVRAQFGPGLVLIHPVGVVVNSAVRGGAKVWIESSVVIGDNRGGYPILGDGVFIGSGAKVIGGVRVGSGARIGANAVVLHDIPEGATAVGIPARCVRTNEGSP